MLLIALPVSYAWRACLVYFRCSALGLSRLTVATYSFSL